MTRATQTKRFLWRASFASSSWTATRDSESMRRARQLDLRFHRRGGLARERAANRRESRRVCHTRGASGSRHDADGLARLEPAKPSRISRHRPGARAGGRALSRAHRPLFGAGQPRAPHRRSGDDARSLTGDAGFSVRVARGLNRMMHRRGRVLSDRFHAHVLRTPTETRRAVAYVRNNYRKHLAEIGRPVPSRFVDEYSSDGRSIALPAPKTWLLKRAVGPPAMSASSSSSSS